MFFLFHCENFGLDNILSTLMVENSFLLSMSNIFDSFCNKEHNIIRHILSSICIHIINKKNYRLSLCMPRHDYKVSWPISGVQTHMSKVQACVSRVHTCISRVRACISSICMHNPSLGCISRVRIKFENLKL